MDSGTRRSTAPVLLFAPLQGALPEFLPDLIGVAGTLVLVLMLVAIGGTVYKHLTGGIEWPDEDADDDEASRGDSDDEWDYY